jgi:hypothetical protein
MRSLASHVLFIPANDSPLPETPQELHDELRLLLLSVHRFQTDSPTLSFSRGVEGLVYYGHRLRECADVLVPFNRQYEKAVQLGNGWYASWHEAAVFHSNDVYWRLASAIDSLVGQDEDNEQTPHVRAVRYAKHYTDHWYDVNKDSLLAEALPIDCEFLYQQTAVELARLPVDVRQRKVGETTTGTVAQAMAPELPNGARAALLQAIYRQTENSQDGVAIVELPRELAVGDDFHLLWADGLIQFIRRRHCFVGPQGSARLVLEKGYEVAELNKRDRLPPGKLIEEALLDNVDPEIRHRVRLTIAGTTAVIRLASMSSPRADKLRYYCDPRVPEDVQRMVRWLNPPHCLSQRQAAAKAAEETQGRWTSIESRFRRHRDKTGLIKEIQ